MHYLNAILKSSLTNCHATGLDSIVLKPAPGMVRIFIAREDHTLWRNNPDTNVHPHHCDITMVPLLGSIANIVLGSIANIVLGSGGPTHKLHQFVYKSGITAPGKSGFQYTGKEVRVNLKHQPLRYPTMLLAKEMHTVYVPKGRVAAWMICEGREWPDYQPTMLSNQRLDTSYSATGLYKPMTVKRLHEDLEILGVQAK